MASMQTPQLCTSLLNSDLSWQYKGWPSSIGAGLDEVADLGWNVFESDFHFPIMVVKESAVQHNIEAMQHFCQHAGLSIAPHGKTTMSPEITRHQLNAGAWGITAATASQARILRAFGVTRILVANQVVDPSGVRWGWQELQADTGFELICLVDSIATVDAMEAALSAEQEGRLIDVLIELGIQGGRTGCRTIAEAVDVAHRVVESSRLRLVGVEGYEGVLPYEPGDFEAVDGFLREVRQLAKDVASVGLFAGLDEVIVSAGGSIFPDRVALILGGEWDIGYPVRTVIRSGGYVAHDSVKYARASPFGVRPPADYLPALQPALFLWAYVVSRPESDLALLGFGKRDVPYDSDLPVPVAVRRWQTVEKTDALEIFSLNDQHAYVRLSSDFQLRVGDMVMCGISHPCAAFDRWRAMPLIDNQYNVVGVVRTFF